MALIARWLIRVLTRAYLPCPYPLLLPVLLCGGTDWPILGRKAAGAVVDPDSLFPDLPTPHTYRPLSNIRIAAVRTSHSSCHTVFLACNGQAYVVGRNESAQCGVPVNYTLPASSSSSSYPSSSSTSYARSNAANGAGEPISRNGSIYTPFALDRSLHFDPPLPAGAAGDIVEAACGRHHTLLVTRAGRVYAAGLDSSGQLGLGEGSGESEANGRTPPPGAARSGANADIVDRFRRIDDAPFVKGKDPVVQVACGNTFSLALTKGGKGE